MSQRKFIQLCLFILLSLVLSVGFIQTDAYRTVHAQSESTKSPKYISYADAVNIAAPAVVSIQTTQKLPKEIHPLMQDPFFRHFFDDIEPHYSKESLQQGLGSGVIFDKNGYILTNNHVIRDASTIIVKLSDGRNAKASIIGTDPSTDLAILKIKIKGNLPIISIGQSSKSCVGDVVLAIGNAFGLESSVTLGIVSAIGPVSTRSSDAASFTDFLDDLIQTDAAINPGNSGGALINTHGELIGINTAILSRSGGNHGIGFAIPVDTAKVIMKELIEKGHIERGWMGAYLKDLNKEMKSYLNYDGYHGVYVQAIIHQSPAQKSGLLPGDIITHINHDTIKNASQIVRIIGNSSPGQILPINIIRKGKCLSLQVIVTKCPQNNN